MSKAQFLVARSLIKEENYEAARALLVTIDHPLAADWLAKLDRIAPVQATTSALDPDAPAPVDSAETFIIDMPSLDELTSVDLPAAKPVAPKAKVAKPEPAVLDYATLPDAEVAPVAPHAIPAPASHAAFRRPGSETAVAAPEMPEPPKSKNVQAKASTVSTNGKKTAAKATPAPKPTTRASANVQGTKPAAPVSVPVLPPQRETPLWQARLSWLLLGTPLPGQEEKDKFHIGAPVDDRTPDDGDEAVDWRQLPSRSHAGQANDMPWLSGKIDARGSYGRVATLSTAPAARSPAGDALEWDFSGELPPPTSDLQPDLDSLTRFHVEAGEGSQSPGRKLFDGLNLVFVGLFSCGVFAFIYTTRRDATPLGESYTVGMEGAFVVIGVLLVLLGLWRILKPEKTPA